MMRVGVLLSILSGYLAAVNLSQAALTRTHNIEIILDASGSMTESVGERTKIEIAKQVVSELIEVIPQESTIQVGLRLYGHQSDKSLHDCRDTKLEVPLGPVDPPLLKSVVQNVQAQGYTPLSLALTESINDFPEAIGSFNIVILITDGVESCQGNPCATAEKLKDSDKAITVHVIGFQLGETNKDTLTCIPQITGGFYYDAMSSFDLSEALRQALNAALHSGFLYIETAGVLDHCKVYDQATGEFIKEIYTKTDVSLLPGKYKIELNTKPPLSLENVVIKKNEKTVIKPEGKGILFVKTQDFISGCKAYDLVTNEVVKEFYTKTQVQLPTGSYRIEIPTDPPDIQEIVIENGQITEVLPKQSGKLFIKTRAIVAGCTIRNRETGEKLKTVYSRTAVALPVGNYRVEIPGDYPRTFDVVIEAGKTNILEVN